MGIEDAVFWVFAVCYVLIAVWFAIRINRIPDRVHKSASLPLVRGQFKDGLLSAAVMWSVVLSRGVPAVKDVLEVGGTLAFLWLVRRALLRLTLLRN